MSQSIGSARWQTHVINGHLRWMPCSHFWRRGNNHEHCQQDRFNKVMNAPDRHRAVCGKHGCQKTGSLMKKSQKLKRKAASATKKLQDDMDDGIEIHAPEEVWGMKEKKSRMVWLGTSQNQSPTSQPWTIIPAGCNQKWSNHQGPMARPGWRRGRIVITTIPEMKISAETIIPTPETVVLSDTGLNGVIYPATIAVIITVQQLQDGPVREAGSGVQRLTWQLLPVLVTVIQQDSRDHRGGLVPRSGYAVQWPSRQPHPCGSVWSSESTQQACDQGHGCGSTKFLASPSTPRHGASTTQHFKSSWWARETHSASVSDVYRYSPGKRHNTTGGCPAEIADPLQAADAA